MRAHCHSAASTATWVAARSASDPNRGRAPVVPSKALPEWIAASWQSVTRLPHDPARAIVSFARENQITQIVIGSVQHSWWHIRASGPILRRVIEEAGASGIDVHLIARREPARAKAPEPSAAKES
jgi:K+-sensing histidine kinase KdpD